MIRATLTFIVASLGCCFFALLLLATGLFGSRLGLVAWCGRSWSGLILWAAGLRLTVEGMDQLEDGKTYFYVGNHQSALDIPILLWATHGRLRFLAKESLFRIPFFGSALKSYGHIPIRRSSARSAIVTLEKMIGEPDGKAMSVLAFPEGTRSGDGRLLPFRRGTMKICQRSGLAIVPFSINGSIAIHKRRVFRVRPGHVRLRFMKPLPSDEIAPLDPSELQELLRSQIAAQVESINGEGGAERVTAASSQDASCG